MATDSDSPIISGAEGHVFARARPSQGGKTFAVHASPPRDTHYRDFHTGPGKPPFRLDLSSVLQAPDYGTIVQNKKLVFHVNGDMGGINYAVPQELVAKGMEADAATASAAGDNPAFLYIVGDCVYFNGEIKQYYTQFYQPYEFYPRPIFAVPGNHDGENLPGDNTLDGFVRNFCAHKAVKMPESQDSHRTAMTQPNVYWTLVTPLANFVGIYSNVPAGGEVKPPQTDWLAEEFGGLPKSVPLIVTLHHPIYSADDHHSGSTYMKKVLEAVVQKSGRQPEMVIAGHVHNYQRLTHKLNGSKVLPHLVTGAGGYHNLHQVMLVNGEHIIPPATFKDNQGEEVTLERYSDDHHGFLRMEITESTILGKYYTVPRPQEPWSKGAQLFDYFEFDWKNRQYVPNTFT